jgi:hypothetical protein
VGDSRAREVVLNSLRQPGLDFVPWVTRTRKAYKLWATLKGPEWFYRLGAGLRKKCFIGTKWVVHSEVGGSSPRLGTHFVCVALGLRDNLDDAT